MSSGSESETESMSSCSSIESDMSSASFHVKLNNYEHYAHEPLADSSESDGENDVDVDGILLTTIQDRYEGKLAFDRWCTCGHCESGLLFGPMEYRSCKEIDAAKQFQCEPDLKSPINCVTEHPDFDAVVLHPRVLRVAANGLKTRRGKQYRQLGSDEGFLRAVAYRLFISMVFGFMGFDNSRPLPACAYVKIRNSFPEEKNNFTGYMSVQERCNLE